MILDELVLENFGVFRGRNVLKLTPPSRRKPLVVVGGLNGTGKTTLLDAVQLTLFGRLAPCVDGNGANYDRYLRALIHRAVRPSTGATLELAFRVREQSFEHRYRIRRHWHTRFRKLQETVEVQRDDHPDRTLSDYWAESVEQFIPLGIARLVFFDGEKIEALADPATSSEALRAGVNALLGLGIVERLASDLTIYERRCKGSLVRGAAQTAVHAAEHELDRLDAERERWVGFRGARQNALDQARKRVEQCEARFRAEGGDLYERRKELEENRDACHRRVREAEDGLRDQATTLAPLLVVEEVIRAAADRADEEWTAVEAQRTHAALTAHDQRVVAQLRDRKKSEAFVAELDSLLSQDRDERQSATTTEVLLGTSDFTRHELRRLSSDALPVFRSLLEEARKALLAAQVEFERSERTLGMIPVGETLKNLIEDREQARLAVISAEQARGEADSELDRIRHAYERQRSKYEHLLCEAAERSMAIEDTHRALRHSARVRKTLDRFRRSLLERSCQRIASLVQEGFGHLLRKQGLITGVELDPENLTLSLRGPDGRDLPPVRLSAGERQLLAIAILWALARACGRPLPHIVDTPLGRLDSTHRSHIVERYFPSASHQVILLSTDEEITPQYWERIHRHVGRSYTLTHDDHRGATSIREGYFQ